MESYGRKKERYISVFMRPNERSHCKMLSHLWQQTNLNIIRLVQLCENGNMMIGLDQSITRLPEQSHGSDQHGLSALVQSSLTLIKSVALDSLKKVLIVLCWQGHGCIVVIASLSEPKHWYNGEHHGPLVPCPNGRYVPLQI